MKAATKQPFLESFGERNVKNWEQSVKLSVASCGALFAIQGQCETWSCNREFESFSSIDCLNGKAGLLSNRWGRREKLTDIFSWESQVCDGGGARGADLPQLGSVGGSGGCLLCPGGWWLFESHAQLNCFSQTVESKSTPNQIRLTLESILSPMTPCRLNFDPDLPKFLADEKNYFLRSSKLAIFVA